MGFQIHKTHCAPVENGDGLLLRRGLQRVQRFTALGAVQHHPAVHVADSQNLEKRSRMSMPWVKVDLSFGAGDVGLGSLGIKVDRDRPTNVP